ncbi:MAG: 50S ribosomal protein L29 [Phycisphaerales bacterium]
MNAKEVRALQDEEIKIELTRLRAKVYELRSETVTEKIKDTSQFGKLKKDIARLLTERRSRSLASAKK